MPDPVEVFAVPLGPLQANCFVVVREQQGLVIDPGDEAHIVIEAFTEFGFAPAAVLVTHGHFDHFGGVAPLARHFDIPVYVGAADAAEMADNGLGVAAGFDIEPVETARTIEGEQTLDLPIPVLAIPTPGHSRGSYTFAIGEDQLFVGDLLFQGSVGRTDLPGGEHGPAAQLRRDAHPAVPAGRRRAQRPRPGHVARPRARAQPLPLAAPLTTPSTAGELAARTQGHRTTCCRTTPRSATPSSPPRRACSPPTATVTWSPPSSRRPVSSSAASARPRTSCARRCTPSSTRATARSRCGPRARRPSAAPTWSTACTSCRSR